MTSSRVCFANTNSAMLVLLSLCVILSSQVDANLLDPTLIGRELQKFAKDALGVDEMQVRITNATTSVFVLKPVRVAACHNRKWSKKKV